MKEPILQRLEPLMRTIFQDPHLVVTPSLTMIEVPTWDSIGHMNLIGAVEESFGFRFELEELVEIDSVTALIDIIQKHLPGSKPA
ncbi:MAG: acyl carrier protein [Magnetococcus sp. YQC-9]